VLTELRNDTNGCIYAHQRGSKTKNLTGEFGHNCGLYHFSGLLLQPSVQ
jgi:hypothetical protein